ncbi:MAG: PEP-CTERM sorting domain-containing protein [Desulforhopalus sp.]|nr:PEP-CTERM sorting domain-containing protein [Desulforhopalus sp.]
MNLQRSIFTNLITVPTFICCFSCLAFGLSDNFNDNTLGSYWTLFEDSHSTLRLAEQNNRLEVIANAPLSFSTDAIYLSNGLNGFQLSTDHDFSISIDYSYTGAAVLGSGFFDAISLVLGVGRDLDGTDSAAIGVARTYFNTLNSVAAYRTDDDQTIAPIGFVQQSSGTMFVSYDAANDDLFLGLMGGDSFTLADTVIGKWNASSLWVSFGARGNGATLVSGNASLDNFQITEGDVNAVPEPATSTLFLAAGAVCLWRRFRKV